MTSVEWVYLPDDQAEREARFAAMNLADLVARRLRSVDRATMTELQAEALAVRRAELVWGDIREADRPVQIVRIGMAQVFWPVVLANVFLGVVAGILYALIHA